MKKIAMTIAALGLLAGTAAAQDFDEDLGGGDDMGGGGGDMGGGMSAPAAGGGTGEGAQMAISAELNGTSDIPAAHLLYNVGGNYLDLVVALNLVNVSPDGGDSTTVFGFGLGLGYRMYNDMDGRIHPYLEPYVTFALSTDEAAGEPKSFGAGAMLGVDFMLFDQFTLGAAIGGGLNFELTEAANTLDIGVYTTSVNATFWWG